MQNLNTHRMIENLVALGMPKEQAELITENTIALIKDDRVSIVKDQANLVTKNDLKVSLLELKTELKTEIVEVKRDIKWGMYALAAIIGLLVKIAFFSN